jgi:hypothetical protein
MVAALAIAVVALLAGMHGSGVAFDLVFGVCFTLALIGGVHWFRGSIRGRR